MSTFGSEGTLAAEFGDEWGEAGRGSGTCVRQRRVADDQVAKAKQNKAKQNYERLFETALLYIHLSKGIS